MATSDRSSWVNTTHDWTAEVDHDHLETIRRDPVAYAPSGVLHLALEVLAYADDEAEALGRLGRCLVMLHNDGSVSVTDDGRGTDTRRDATGHIVRKPVMSTADLRFFDSPAVNLPDGHPRRGISVVAALSRWLVHTNRRTEGSWTQRYDRGVPTTGLVPLESSGTTGTLVHFLPDALLVPRPTSAAEVRDLANGFAWLDVEVAARSQGLTC